MPTPAKSARREDKLPLERALRALEVVHRLLKDFSATDTVTENAAFAAELKISRHKAKKRASARTFRPRYGTVPSKPREPAWQ
jgi:hypothetical protein